MPAGPYRPTIPYPGDWDLDAACLGEDPAMFFPGQGEAHGPALRICADCPVKEPCLEHALKHERSGIWGGTSERERRRLRRMVGIEEPKELGLAPGRASPGNPRGTYCNGTNASYHSGCRCVECGAAHRAYNRAGRIRRAGGQQEDVA
jgi:WhiB family redox-sensing transcriptional regulator